jgi:hypothetical protein
MDASLVKFTTIEAPEMVGEPDANALKFREMVDPRGGFDRPQVA